MMDQVFQFIVGLEHNVPVHWIWISTSLHFPFVHVYVHHDTAWIQIAILVKVLSDIASALFACCISWITHLETTDAGRFDHDSGRPILHGPASSMRRSFPDTSSSGFPIQWTKDTWPGAVQETFRFLAHQIRQLWEVGRADPDGGPAVSSSRGSIECLEYGPLVFVICSMRTGQSDALIVGENQIMEHAKANWRDAWTMSIC